MEVFRIYSFQCNEFNLKMSISRPKTHFYNPFLALNTSHYNQLMTDVKCIIHEDHLRDSIPFDQCFEACIRFLGSPSTFRVLANDYKINKMYLKTIVYGTCEYITEALVHQMFAWSDRRQLAAHENADSPIHYFGNITSRCTAVCYTITRRGILGLYREKHAFLVLLIDDDDKIIMYECMTKGDMRLEKSLLYNKNKECISKVRFLRSDRDCPQISASIRQLCVCFDKLGSVHKDYLCIVIATAVCLHNRCRGADFIPEDVNEVEEDDCESVTAPLLS